MTPWPCCDWRWAPTHRPWDQWTRGSTAKEEEFDLIVSKIFELENHCGLGLWWAGNRMVGVVSAYSLTVATDCWWWNCTGCHIGCCWWPAVVYPCRVEVPSGAKDGWWWWWHLKVLEPLWRSGSLLWIFGEFCLYFSLIFGKFLAIN